MLYNIHCDVIRRQIPDFLFDGNSNVCYIFQHFEIFAIQEKCQKNFDLENEGRGQGVEEWGLAPVDGKCSILYW